MRKHRGCNLERNQFNEKHFADSDSLETDIPTEKLARNKYHCILHVIFLIIVFIMLLHNDLRYLVISIIIAVQCCTLREKSLYIVHYYYYYC